MIVEIDSDKDGEIHMDEWVNYILVCKDDIAAGKKTSLTKQLDNQEKLKLLETTLCNNNNNNRINI